MMKSMNETNSFVNKYSRKICRVSILSDQRGFNVIEFLVFVAIIVLLGVIVIPNMNLFLGVDRKIAAANVEAANMRSAAISYEVNHSGVYPANSDILWNNPPASTDYVGQPRAYYTFDVGTGRIIDAAVDAEHVSTNAWTGIKWDFTSGSWVKQ
jgi:type II secretory pathway pseudopilin PulG